MREKGESSHKMSTVEKDYAEILLDAISTVSTKIAESMSYDQTILCQIVDDSRKAEGFYTVSNTGSAKFTAVSSDTSYKTGDSVYVQIPGGDYDAQKTIISKQVNTEENEAYVYNKPFSTLIDITGNLVDSPIAAGQTGLVANAPASSDSSAMVLWTYNDDENSGLVNTKGEAVSSYTRLGLQAGFRSYLSPFEATIKDNSGNIIDSGTYEVTTGEYGLKLRVYCEKEQTATEVNKDSATELYSFDFVLNQDDMNGNPYDYATFYQNEKVFDISECGKIVAMKLVFYETADTFTDAKSGARLPHTDFLGNLIKPNLNINDLYISLGYDVSEFSDEMVTVYTLDTPTYNKEIVPESANHKKLCARWIHKDDNGVFVSVGEKTKLNYEVRWYRYELGHPSADEYSGVYWKLLSTQKATTIGTYVTQSYTIEDQDWIDYHAALPSDDSMQADGVSTEGHRRDPGFFYSWCIPNLEAQTERYKVIILHDGHVIRSKELTFENETLVANDSTITKQDALQIYCEDGTFGNYFVYWQGGTVMDKGLSSQERTFVPYMTMPTSDGGTELQEVTQAEKIQWVIPVEKSMLTLSESWYGNDWIEERRNSDGKIAHFQNGNQPFYQYIDKDGEVIIDETKYVLINGELDDVTNWDFSTLVNIIITRYGAAPADGDEKARKNDLTGRNTQIYKIRSNYQQGRNNNTVKCIVWIDGVEYQTSKDLSFGTSGSSGTDVTLVLDYKDPRRNSIHLKEDSGVIVQALLYDQQGNEVNFNNATIAWSWKNEDEQLFATQRTNDMPYNEIELKWANTKPSTLGATYNILKCDVTNFGDYMLTAYFPIAISDYVEEEKEAFEPVYIDGTTEVIYDSDGVPYNYSTGRYSLNAYNKVVDGTIWELAAYGGDDKFTPKVKKAGAYYLEPTGVYVENANEEICVLCKIDGNVVWSQPILITKNRYSSGTINAWDGELVVDNKNNQILAARLAAGRKDSNNTFSGVILGDWGGEDNSDAINGRTGIYGFHEGAMSYAIKDDGTMFLGKSGCGRIEFDGTNGIIKNTNGTMTIDIDTGSIEMTGSEGYISIDSSNSTHPLQIGSNFSVEWNGKLHATGGYFGDGEIEGGSIKLGDYLKFVPLNDYDGQYKGHIGGWQFDYKKTLADVVDENGKVIDQVEQTWSGFYSDDYKIYLDPKRQYPIAIGIKKDNEDNNEHYFRVNHNYSRFTVENTGAIRLKDDNYHITFMARTDKNGYAWARSFRAGALRTETFNGGAAGEVAAVFNVVNNIDNAAGPHYVYVQNGNFYVQNKDEEKFFNVNVATDATQRVTIKGPAVIDGSLKINGSLFLGDQQLKLATATVGFDLYTKTVSYSGSTSCAEGHTASYSGSKDVKNVASSVKKIVYLVDATLS